MAGVAAAAAEACAHRRLRGDGVPRVHEQPGAARRGAEAVQRRRAHERFFTELLWKTTQTTLICAKDGRFGVHARGRSTVADWQDFPGRPWLKMPSGFTTGPDATTLLYDEIVVHDQKRVAIAFALVVEKGEVDDA